MNVSFLLAGVITRGQLLIPTGFFHRFGLSGLVMVTAGAHQVAGVVAKVGGGVIYRAALVMAARWPARRGVAISMKRSTAGTA